MSTSDAGELELRVVGGETATPLCRTARATRNTTAREQQDETFGERHMQENHHDDETTTVQQSRPSANQQEEAHKALRADRLRKEETSHCGDAKVQNQKQIGRGFTSSFFLRVSSKPGLDNPKLRPKKNSDPFLYRLTETQKTDPENCSCQVNGQTSPTDTSIKVTSDSPLSEGIPFPAKKEGVCNELKTTTDLSITHSFSNGKSGTHERNGLPILSCGSHPRKGTRSFELEDIQDHTKIEKQTDLVELYNPTQTMLSSTVVTVLAPHWSGRLRRTKRFEGNGNSEAVGNLRDVTNIASNRTHELFQDTVDRSLTDGSQAQTRVPFLGTRRNTVGWSTKSGPASLDYESKRKMIQTVSLDVNSGRMNNRNIDTGVLNHVTITASPLSPLSHDPNEQRRNPQTTGHQGALSSLSSKPTTSSLLLSLRRLNSNGRNSNSASNLSEINPSLLSSLPTDREGKLFTSHLSQTFNNNNEQERSNPLLSPSSISYRTETGPFLSQSSSNHRGRNIFETRVFSVSPRNKDAEDTPFTQQPLTINRTQPGLSCSKQAFLSRALERQQNSRGLDKSTNLLSESSGTSPRHSPYDHSALSRRTTLASTSWWKQVTHEGSSPLTLNDTTNIKDKPNTPLVPPCNDNSDLASTSLTDNKRFGSQIPNNRDNNNTAESVRKSNMNLVMKTQGGSHNLKQRTLEDLPDHESDRLVKQHYGFNLNNREPQKPHSLPDVLSSSKISKATLSHPKDLSKHDVSNSSFTANVTELPPTSLNSKTSNTPTESSGKHSNRTSKTNSTPISPHNKDSQKFTKPSTSLAATNTHSSQTSSILPLTPNTSSSFDSHVVASQTIIQAPSYTGSSPKFTYTSNATPLGFERSYASVSRPFHPKTVPSLSPPVSAFSKTKYTPVSIASPTSSSTTGSHSPASDAPSLSLLKPPYTPAIASSPTITISSLLTPPATPSITSPSYSETSSPKEGKTFSISPEKNSKKLLPCVKGKRVRRVTWDDSVDIQHSEPMAVEEPETSPVPVSPQSPSGCPRSVKAPSIFSFLRSSCPATNTSSLCSPSPKTSSIQVVKGGKYRSLSSDSADLASRDGERSKQRSNDNLIFDQGRRDLTTTRQERTLSVDTGTVQCRSSAPLSLPPDFSSGYKLRYSSPPYSTLMSTRSTQGETKTITPRSSLFQQNSQSNYNSHLPMHTDPLAAMTIPTFKPPPSPMSLPQPLTLHFQNKTVTRESSKFGASENDQVNNNHSKNNNQGCRNGQILLVDNRVQISSQSLQGDKAHNSSSTCVTETLVYSIKSKVNTSTPDPKITTPKPLQHITKIPVSVESKLSQEPHMAQGKETTDGPHNLSDQSSSASCSTEPPDDESSTRRMKESLLGKNRFFSVESNNEQSPKRSRFALKKSVSTPNSSLSRSESERTNRTSNKMDQVLNRLKQTFSTRRSDDDILFPWKWKRASQTPSISGSSDISSVGDIIVESTKTPEEREQEKGMVLKDNEKEMEGRWTQNRYTLIPPTASVSTVAVDKFSIWSDISTPESDLDEQNACAEHVSENKNKPYLTIHSPTTQQFDFYKDSRTDCKPSNQFLSCRDPSPGRSPNPSASQFMKSSSSPRSPFSPFSSLSPLSPFPSPDVTDDSVFYSPKLQRRRESSSPCEPVEGISLGRSRRSRASTGPPSAGPGQDKECLASSYADLKYGIEPGRSFSVSSVLSSRPSGPSRISTGSRFMSVGDLSDSALTCGAAGKDLDQWSVTPDWTTEYDFQPTKDCRMSYFPSEPGEMRSRSLPRSLTRRLANWSSEDSASLPVTTTTSKPARLWSPNMNTCHFAWDTEGPPTPPPTPPLSPVSRRMSKPPSLSSPTFPSSSGAPQQVDNQSSRGHLPSRGYVSSLSTFEESSDSSSDTTTDDEYYLETGEDEEKETEL